MSRDHRICKHRGKFAVTYIGDDGQRHRVTAGTTDRRAAERFLSEFVRLRTPDKPKETFTVAQIFEAYRMKLGDRPSATTALHEWKALSVTFGRVTGAQLLAIDSQTRQTGAERLSLMHIERRQAAGRKDNTILTELNRLRTACNWAVPRGMLESAPVFIVPAQPRPKDHWLTRDQVATFLEACTLPHVRLFVVLAIATGGRMGAILDLTWDRVDFAGGRILLDDPDRSATPKGRANVPMNATARAALQEAQRGALTPFVVEWAGKQIASVKKALAAAAARSGVDASAHVFRHSAAVWMSEANVPIRMIADYLGHTNTGVTERVYGKHRPDNMRQAGDVLELNFIRKVG